MALWKNENGGWEDFYQDKKAFAEEKRKFEDALPRYWNLIQKVNIPTNRKSLITVYNSVVKRLGIYNKLVTEYLNFREWAVYLSTMRYVSNEMLQTNLVLAASYEQTALSKSREIKSMREEIKNLIRVISDYLKSYFAERRMVDDRD